MIDFYVPRLPVKRLIVEDDELVGFAAFGDDFAVLFKVDQRGDTASSTSTL